MAADQKIELELALRDSVSVALRTIAGNIDQMNAKLTRGGEEIRQGTDTLSKVAKNTKDIGESARTASRHLVGLGDTLIKVSSLLTTGPVAIGAGIVATTAAIGRQLKGVADERLRLKALSEDSGLSEDKISIMMRTQARQGINPEQATKNIEIMTGKLKDMSTQKTGSEIYRGLVDIGMARYGKQLLDSVTSGDFAKAVSQIFDQYAEIYKTHGATAAMAYAQVVGVHESFLQTYKAASEGVKPAYRLNLEAAQSWADRWAIVHENLEMMWDTTIGSMIWTLVRIDEGIASLEGVQKKFPTLEGLESAVPGSEGMPIGPDLPNLPGGSQDAEDLKDSKKDSAKILDDTKGILERRWERLKGLVGRQEGGPILAGRDYQVGEAGPEVFNAGGEYSLVGEGGPERFRSKKPGMLEKFEQKSAGMTAGQLGTGLALKKFAPGPIGWALSVIAADEDKAWRDWARTKLGGVFGYDPEVGTPNPWEVGGSWDKDPQSQVAQKLGDQDEEHQKHMENMAAMSAQIAPHGLNWEQWRRSENVEGVESGQAEQEWFESPYSMYPGEGDSFEAMAERERAAMARYSERGPLSEQAGIGDIERMIMDRASPAMAGRHSMAAEIEFNNVPPGVETEASGEGFDEFNVNKTKQLEFQGAF
jgi:hypothetical protein